jgi:hypothetical protein
VQHGLGKRSAASELARPFETSAAALGMVDSIGFPSVILETNHSPAPSPKIAVSPFWLNQPGSCFIQSYALTPELMLDILDVSAIAPRLERAR